MIERGIPLGVDISTMNLDINLKRGIKMKKALVAAAVISAFSSAVCASDITLYGLIDYGFAYQHVDSNLIGSDAENSFKMKSGIASASRFGIRGTESLGNGLKVGFILENGFNADDGALTQTDRIFGREAMVYLEGNVGKLVFGRVGQLASGNGSMAITGKINPFGTTFGEYAANIKNFATGYDRLDNAVTYVSPAFKGLRVHAQYSFGKDSRAYGDGIEGKSTVDRMYGLGLTYKNGQLDAVIVVDSNNYSTLSYGHDVNDSLSVTLGGSYDFGMMKPYIGAQYFKDAMLDTIDGYDYDGIDGITSSGEGFGVTIGTDVPLWGGTAKIAVGYLNADVDNWNGEGINADVSSANIEFSRWAVSTGYVYNLSKRTNVYGVLSYMEESISADGHEKGSWANRDPNAVEFAIGMRHSF